jgi:16S rRNA (guanine527-N7)-methyltransferase
VTRPAASPTPSAPAAAGAVFGAGLPLAKAYAARLADDGVRRGLIGPREAGRIWERHLLNCAVVADLLPPGCRLVDVGSGAGLPGVPIALRRPDLSVDLVEPMQRRARFLTEVLAELDLADRVRVVRGRAEDAAVAAQVGGADWLTARAVAPLERLAAWCRPLAGSGARLLALKGTSAAAEAADAAPALRRLGWRSTGIEAAGRDVLAEPTRVVVLEYRGPRVDRTTRGSA